MEFLSIQAKNREWTNDGLSSNKKPLHEIFQDNHFSVLFISLVHAKLPIVGAKVVWSWELKVPDSSPLSGIFYWQNKN